MTFSQAAQYYLLLPFGCGLRSPAEQLGEGKCTSLLPLLLFAG